MSTRPSQSPQTPKSLARSWSKSATPDTNPRRPGQSLSLVFMSMGTVDDYFGTLDAETRAAFERIRTLVLEIVPQTDQGSSYGMAALKHKDKGLLGFAAAKRHLSVFPFSSRVIDEVRDRLPGFRLVEGNHPVHS